MKELVLKFQYDSKYFEDIFNFFKSTIKTYSISLNYYCSESDLIIFLYELLLKINISDFSCDYYLENYIKRCLKREFIRLKKSTYNEYKIIFDSELLDINLNIVGKENIEYEYLEFLSLIKKLSYQDQKILYLRYYNLLSDSDIAKILNVSRQAIYKRRINSLHQLKRHLKNIC